MTKSKTPIPPTPPTPIRARASGFLYCRVCCRSWAYTGFADDPETWPTHRCKRNVGPMHEFHTEDPNHRTFIAEVEAELDAALDTLRRTVKLD